ncbi:hypothetical protein [Patulibacter sp.]|uniref:hypothetical protein n=1 Tax=Patulibacter sp. TaxID=1912859 RepID=UPI0027252CEC|nr:hypothetical protein [Patulibacter sp.]MDO9409441.1 hypothetical protein [Patulibacter sp.]
MPVPHSPTDRAGSRRDPTSARAARLGIPLVLVVLAIVAAIAVSGLLAAVFLGAAVVAVVADLWIRLGIRSQDDRDDEARARRIFRRRGRWPSDD